MLPILEWVIIVIYPDQDLNSLLSIGYRNYREGLVFGATNGVVSWTPAAAGTYYYQCSVHDGMYGTITVQ